MKAYFTEVLYVLALSKRTQWALMLGLVFFTVISLLGDYMASTLELSGSIASLENVIGAKLLKSYDKAALVALVSFWLLAVKAYRRDRDRFS